MFIALVVQHKHLVWSFKQEKSRFRTDKGSHGDRNDRYCVGVKMLFQGGRGWSNYSAVLCLTNFYALKLTRMQDCVNQSEVVRSEAIVNCSARSSEGTFVLLRI